MSETSEITGPLLKMLRQAGALAFRMQSGRIPIGRRWVHLCEEGTADILCFPRVGGVVWIETKDPAGRTQKQRKEKQLEFRRTVEALGHRFILARTIDEGLDALSFRSPCRPLALRQLHR